MRYSENFWAIVPAAGIGKRMQVDKPKQYLKLFDKTVLEQTLNRLLQSQVFSAIVVAISKTDIYWSNLKISKNKQIITAIGGKERADSVLSALYALKVKALDSDWVLVHDAVRPCITYADIHHLINSLKNATTGGVLAIPSNDTLKQVGNNQKIIKTLNRNNIWRALTPQMFRYNKLKQALKATTGNLAITDEANALELCGSEVEFICGRTDNIKITCPEDLALAQFYMDKQT